MKELLESHKYDSSFNTCVVVMAGGQGRRLSSVTDDKIPKDFVELAPGIRGIDRTYQILERLGLRNVIYAVNYYAAQYAADFSRRESLSPKLHYQKEGDSHGIDLKKIIDEYGTDSQYLILTTDMYFEPEDLGAMLQGHKKGTMTWATAGTNGVKEMEEYRHLLSRDKVLLGFNNTKYRNRIQYSDDELTIRSGIVLIDPELYIRGFNLFQRMTPKDAGVDLYKDIGMIITEMSRRFAARGGNPFVFTHEFKSPLIDYGSPQRLELVRAHYQHI